MCSVDHFSYNFLLLSYIVYHFASNWNLQWWEYSQNHDNIRYAIIGMHDIWHMQIFRLKEDVLMLLWNQVFDDSLWSQQLGSFDTMNCIMNKFFLQKLNICIPKKHISHIMTIKTELVHMHSAIFDIVIYFDIIFVG